MIFSGRVESSAQIGQLVPIEMCAAKYYWVVFTTARHGDRQRISSTTVWLISQPPMWGLMDSRVRFIIASLVAASVAHIFAVLAFTGSLNLVATGVFLVAFLVVLLGFERFMQRVETLESTDSPATRQ